MGGPKIVLQEITVYLTKIKKIVIFYWSPFTSNHLWKTLKKSSCRHKKTIDTFQHIDCQVQQVATEKLTIINDVTSVKYNQENMTQDRTGQDT